MTIAFLFPGQGSQFVGMGKDVANASPAAKKIYEQADKILNAQLSALCWDGPEADLNDTYNTQPALYICSMATLAAIREKKNVTPTFVAGHSLGEVTALAAAGALSFEDGLKLVRERGRLMKRAGELSPGGMAAILNLETGVLTEVCAEASSATGKVVQVANDNCPGQTVISGDNAALEKAMELAKAKGAKRALKLPVSIAAHSPLMKVVVDDYAKFVNSLTYTTPTLPVIANASALPLTDIDSIKKELVSQLTTQVRWTDSIRYIASQGVTKFYEIGSKDVLTGLLKRIAPDSQGVAVGTPETVESF
jgi:[acyl-carrier-protein] S-malonyltransferase